MTTGLFGKLPAHGDFVRRGLPRSFVAPWDEWLSAGIEAARTTLGEAWAAAWEAAPVWRFRISPGLCGPDAVVGVVATSRDMVGRRFPLTLAAMLPGAAIPPPDEWYAALEAAIAPALAGDLDADALVALLPSPPADDLDATLDGRSLFWTAGLPARAMPGAVDFVGLFDHPAASAPAKAVEPQADQPCAAPQLAEEPMVTEAGPESFTEAAPAEAEASDGRDAADDMLALVIATPLDGKSVRDAAP